MTPLRSFKSILITGGTGSFGQRFVQHLLQNYTHFEQIIIFSRDEYKQYQMARKFSPKKYPALRYVLGDVRDEARLREVFQGIEVIIHAAALKQVDTSEQNPMEFIKTNVLGASHVIAAARTCGVKRVIALSSDKAVHPVSLYGASKLCAEKLFLQAGRDQSASVFSLVRYGNVIGSRGSVVPLFLEEKKKKVLPITHPKMTRFSVPVGIESQLIVYAIEHSRGGEIFISKAPSYQITQLAEALCPDCQQEIIGLRPGEKLHEELIHAGEISRTYDTGEHFVIFPPGQVPSPDLNLHLVSFQEAYTSDQNVEKLSIVEIQAQIDAFLESGWDY